MKTLKEYMEQEKKESKQYKIFKFFADSDKIDEDVINDFLKENNFSEDDFKEIVYDILHVFCNSGEWNRNDRPDVDVDQLMKGIQVEFEHTDNHLVAEKIALDHLSESDNSGKVYYSFLEIMERMIEEKFPLDKLEKFYDENK